MLKYKYKVTDNKNPLASVKNDPGQHVLLNKEGTKVLKVVTVTGPNLTEQSFKDQTNIEHILRDVHNRGYLRRTVQFEGTMDDFPAFDFVDAQNKIAKARSAFEALPSTLRNKFNNEPAQFLNFVNDPKNYKEMIELGLAKMVDGKKMDGTPSPMKQPIDQKKADDTAPLPTN